MRLQTLCKSAISAFKRAHVVDWCGRMWQGLGDILNGFREQLGLGPLSMLTGPMATERLRIPFTYAWSASLLPKPDEWKEHIGEWHMSRWVR